MTPADRPKLLALLTGVHSFYRADLTEFGFGVWERALAGYSIEQVAKAFDEHAADPKAGSFMPKPADLIRLLAGTHEDRALLAWGKVLAAIERVGSWQSVAFDDPAIHAAIVDLGGWQQVCRAKTDELPFLQRRFCDAHSAYGRRGAFAWPPYLPGAAAIANGAKGHDEPLPVLIGDQQAARLVLERGTWGAKTPIAALPAADAVRLLERN